MEKIKQFLNDNGYTLYESDNVIEGNNGVFQVMIVKNEKYLVRLAVGRYFDRWANSGTEKLVSTEDKVIETLQDEDFISNTISELVYSIVEYCKWNKDNTNVNTMINFLCGILEQEENE